MNFLNRLERKFGKYAISNLMLYIMMGQAIVFAFTQLTGNNLLIDLLYFNPYLIIRGQIWRLFSFVFIPSNLGSSSLLSLFHLPLFLSSFITHNMSNNTANLPLFPGTDYVKRYSTRAFW